MEQHETCNCGSYHPLELTREQITTRIKQTKSIVATLEKLSKPANGSILYRCKICGQFWQKSIAWNWNGNSYMFQVPEIDVRDWEVEQFISPADILIYSARMDSYFKENVFTESKENCRVENCPNKSIQGDVVCKKHFVENLQKIGLLPKNLTGRMFDPYHY